MCFIILYCIIIIAQFSVSLSLHLSIPSHSRKAHTHTHCNIAKSIVLPSIKILTWKSDKSLIAENKRMYVWCVCCCVYVWFYFNFVVKRLLMKVNGFVWMESHEARALLKFVYVFNVISYTHLVPFAIVAFILWLVLCVCVSFPQFAHHFASKHDTFHTTSAYSISMHISFRQLFPIGRWKLSWFLLYNTKLRRQRFTKTAPFWLRLRVFMKNRIIPLNLFAPLTKTLLKKKTASYSINNHQTKIPQTKL